MRDQDDSRRPTKRTKAKISLQRVNAEAVIVYTQDLEKGGN
jgi:hypothetical protein